MKKKQLGSFKEFIKTPTIEKNELLEREKQNYFLTMSINTNIQKTTKDLIDFYSQKVSLYFLQYSNTQIEKLSFNQVLKNVQLIIEEKDLSIKNKIIEKKIKIFDKNIINQESEKEENHHSKDFYSCEKKRDKKYPKMEYSVENVKKWLIDIKEKEKFFNEKIEKSKTKERKRKLKEKKMEEKKLQKEKVKKIEIKKEIFRKNNLIRLKNKEEREKFKKNLQENKNNLLLSSFYKKNKENEEKEKNDEIKFIKKLEKIKEFYKPIDFKELNNFSLSQDRRKLEMQTKRNKMIEEAKFDFKSKLLPLIKVFEKDKNPENLTFSLFSEYNLEKNRFENRKKYIKNRHIFSQNIKSFLPKINKENSIEKSKLKKKEVSSETEKRKKEYENYLKKQKLGLKYLSISKKKACKNNSTILKNKELSLNKITNFKNYINRDFTNNYHKNIDILKKSLKCEKEDKYSETLRILKNFYEKKDFEMDSKKFSYLHKQNILPSISMKIDLLNKVI